MYSEEEVVQLINMQNSWHQGRRSSSTFSLLGHQEEPELFSEKSLHTTSLEVSSSWFEKKDCSSKASQLEDVEPNDEESSDEIVTTTFLDASKLGDIPATYVIHKLAPHQFPVSGVYIDRRILPGFKYSVVPLRAQKKHLFNGRGLILKSIGRGYARRFTFVEEDATNLEENCFWSDNDPDGYAFELRAVSIGDKFTVYDVNHEPEGTLEVVDVDGRQIEINGGRRSRGFEKRVKVRMTAMVGLYDGTSQSLPVMGVAVYVKRHDEKFARTVKVINVNINHHRYYLLPGFEKNSRWVKVNGNEINDVPTMYTVKGIEPHELPAVGTYVDPRILPGFAYKVRPVNSKRHLFNGVPLKLLSIGQGYAKRFTFESHSTLDNDNFFWSDNNPEGFAFETRAVYEKTRFNIISNDQIIGEAKVFRSDLPQMEHCTKKEQPKNGETLYIKHVHVNLLCHVKLDVKNSGSVDESLMRVCGLAILVKSNNEKVAKLEKIENVALDSQINLLFARANANLTFIPLS